MGDGDKGWGTRNGMGTRNNDGDEGWVDTLRYKYYVDLLVILAVKLQT